MDSNSVCTAMAVCLLQLRLHKPSVLTSSGTVLDLHELQRLATARDAQAYLHVHIASNKRYLQRLIVDTVSEPCRDCPRVQMVLASQSASISHILSSDWV